MFAHWAEFYLMIGSAAAALIGLLFVVVTLTAGAKRIQRGTTIFMTPAVFHLAMIVVLSAIAMAPDLSPTHVGAAIAASAIVAIIYMSINAAAVWREPREHWSDRWAYAIAPLALYVVLAFIAAAICAGRPEAPHWYAALVVALLLLTIRNAWDLVTWIAPRIDDLKHPTDET